MQIYEIDPLADPRWKAFTQARHDACVFHSPEWLKALKLCYRYEPLVLSTTPPGVPLENGFVLCKVRSALTGNRFVSLPFSDTCEPLVNSGAETDAFVNYLVEKVDDSGWRYVELRPIHQVPTRRNSFGTSSTYYLHTLDISRSEESLYKSFHKDCVQRKIRRAARERLRYESGSNERLLKIFYKLLIMTRRRQSLAPQPMNWFRVLLSCMGEKVTIRVAFKEQTPVAAILTATDKKTMIYKYGCSDARYSNLGGTAILFWNAIREARASGIETLDMGRSDVENVGLINYKEHWGAKRHTLNYWRYPGRATASLPERAIQRYKGLSSFAPDWSLVMMGNLLYRHIG